MTFHYEQASKRANLPGSGNQDREVLTYQDVEKVFFSGFRTDKNVCPPNQIKHLHRTADILVCRE
jgi:hypothetical protein